ncbi:MAG: hypothetical protein COS99_02265 [Candidatus Omnitrophica bacterium CG07_land_8_20_14_0_80_42_15]|uniref:PDZ domain-containing protein n=1 Tax=Candidatus Aquitaenariimonas noxiae TaxID=1974741 RepID=A0A2J0L1Q1_9BACT|nr:MAG: hypothetical protein COS99_02265 [Candidatus Omnitrophica bacterium CG07_land_8_20_14_0_80_42_15]
MKSKIFFICTSILFLAYGLAIADKVTLKDGTMLKGVIVEDYADRITLSTFEGEKSIMKSDATAIESDTIEDNILGLAAQYTDKSDFEKAYYYYEQAYKLNPGSKAARDGFTVSRQILFKKEQLLQQAEVKKWNMIQEFNRSKISGVDTIKKDNDAALKDSIGIKLEMEGTSPKVTEVLKGSPADSVGIMRGDKIIAIWSRLTGYLSKKDLLSRLLDPNQTELKLTIERAMAVTKEKPSVLTSAQDLVGATFVLQYEGITVENVISGGPADKAGLKPGDLVISVRGNFTRYMSLDMMYNIIKECKNKVDFVDRREVTVWKKTSIQ